MTLQRVGVAFVSALAGWCSACSEAGDVSPAMADSAAVTSTTAPPPIVITNPAALGDFPDPDVLRWDGGWLATSTGPADVAIQGAVSEDMATWRLTGDLLHELPAWAVSDRSLVWAPDVTAVSDAYELWFTARDRDSGQQCIGVARAERPVGPYEPVGDDPVICQSDLGGSIDPSVFTDDRDTRWLLWKNDGNCCGIRSQIWVQELAPDEPAPVGEAAAVLKRDQPWEVGDDPGRTTIEAPEMVQGADGVFHLFYSGNGWDRGAYAVGHAVCDAPLGPCRKSSGHPILSERAEVAGPGGASVTTGPDGEPWVAFHAWEPGAIGNDVGERRLWLSRLHLDGTVAAVLGPQVEVVVQRG